MDHDTEDTMTTEALAWLSVVVAMIALVGLVAC